MKKRIEVIGSAASIVEESPDLRNLSPFASVPCPSQKYPSFEADYNTFLDELEKNPFSGEPLGKHTYKNRMTIISKGKGEWWCPRFNL